MTKDIMSYCGDDVLDAADKYWNNAKKQTLLRRLTVIGVAALLGAGLIAAALFTAAKINNHVPKPPETTAALPLNGVTEEVTTAAGTSASPDDSVTAADTAGEITEPPVTDTETEAGSVTQPPETPEFKDPVFTAAEIGALFDEQKLEGALTNAYVKIAVPSEDELKYSCMPVPQSDTVGIYKIHTENVKKAENDPFTMEQFWNKVCAGLGVKTDKRGEWYDDDLYIRFSDNTHYFSTFSFGRYTGGVNKNLTFDGIDITVDQTMSDGEMKDSLKPIRDKLCDTFNVDLPDIYIERRYDEYSQYGCEDLTVTFYNEKNSGVDINICGFCSDMIRINFTNREDYDGAVVSRDVLTRAQVEYYHFHCEPEAICEHTGDARLISIKEAEELLYKGYVFGGHCCPLCMAAQEKVSFENYDKVGIVYFKGIPFYAFFKNLHSDTPNGNAVYARTLVPAVEISGYKEYFESQKEFHKGR